MRRLAWLLALVAGCSFAFVTGPPRVLPPGPSPLECTTSRQAPILDTVGAVVLGAGTLLFGLAAVSFDHYDCDNDCYTPAVTTGEGAVVVAVSALIATPWILSASAGYRRVDKCRKANLYRADTPFWGQDGHACRPDRSCDDGLACVAGRCAAAPAVVSPSRTLPGPGEACLRDPTIPVGRCSAGLVCRSDRCGNP